MSDIQIFIACHRDDIFVPDNPLLFPIQVGTALSDRRFEGMLHDDEGENISEKNESYCELTAQYWAWKNADADYYGFFHYRRYFSFSEEVFGTNCFSEARFAYNDKETLERISLDDSVMRDTIEAYDLIIPETGVFANMASLREQYEIADQHHIEDLDCVLAILNERHPEMINAANTYLDGKKGYFCNMFIMKKELFNFYSEWLFDILEEHERRRDFSMYDPASYRVSGYLAERLFGIFVTWLKQVGGVRIKELQRAFFEDVIKPKPVTPLDANGFSGEPVALVLSANDHYVPYLGTLLQSIKDNSSTSRLYDIIILNRDISEQHQHALSRMMKSKNFSMRFYDTTRLMKDYESKLFLRGHFRIETYFRIFMQDILPCYHKALYLDADMVVNHDIAELYDTDVSGYLLAAVQDPDTAGLYNGYEPQKKDYMDNVMKLEDPYSYFQAGTILFNLDEFRKTYTVEEMFEYATSYDWELLDQDVLNHFAEGRVKYLDMRWNVMMDWRGIRIKKIIGRAPKFLYDQYMEARNDPYIVHYAGPDKPWVEFDSDLADFFWKYAARTPFLPIIIERGLYEKEHRPFDPKSALFEFAQPIYTKYFPPHTKRREYLSAQIWKVRNALRSRGD